jgi:hypothetical protein
MREYRIQRKAIVWHEVIIEADNEAQALEIGYNKLEQDEGYEVSFEWQEDMWSSDK